MEGCVQWNLISTEKMFPSSGLVDEWLAILLSFQQSFSDIRIMVGYPERLCAMKPHLLLGRFPWVSNKNRKKISRLSLLELRGICTKTTSWVGQYLTHSALGAPSIVLMQKWLDTIMCLSNGTPKILFFFFFICSKAKSILGFPKFGLISAILLCP